jgi:hypothetical protein
MKANSPAKTPALVVEGFKLLAGLRGFWSEQ